MRASSILIVSSILSLSTAFVPARSGLLSRRSCQHGWRHASKPVITWDNDDDLISDKAEPDEDELERRAAKHSAPSADDDAEAAAAAAAKKASFDLEEERIAALRKSLEEGIRQKGDGS